MSSVSTLAEPSEFSATHLNVPAVFLIAHGISKADSPSPVGDISYARFLFVIYKVYLVITKRHVTIRMTANFNRSLNILHNTMEFTRTSLR